MALSSRVVPPPVRDGLLLLARLLLAWIFLHEGFVLAANLDRTFAVMAKLGVPASLAAAIILLQLGAGLAVLQGELVLAALVRHAPEFEVLEVGERRAEAAFHSPATMRVRLVPPVSAPVIPAAVGN